MSAVPAQGLRSTDTPLWKQRAKRTNNLDLRVALRQLREMSREEEIDPHIAAWARHTLGLTGASLEEWCAQAWWGRAAAYAVSRRIMRNRDREVREIIAETDWSPLRELLARGRGLIVAGAHLGPRFVVHLSLRWAGFGVRALTGNAKLRSRFGNDVVDMHDEVARGASLVSAAIALRRGKIVYVMADGRHGQQSINGDLIGHHLTLPTGLLALMRSTGTPSIPIDATWQDEMIHIEIGSPMPQPDAEGGAREAAWTEAYFAWYRSVILKSPANLRLAGGFWQPGTTGFL